MFVGSIGVSTGIVLGGDGATNAIVEGNYIGVDPSGRLVGNEVGVSSYASGLLLGGTTPEAANVIGGSSGPGVALYAPATVEGNLIGTDPTGVHPVPNNVGIYAITGGAGGTVIGGNATGAGNLISGNAVDGVALVSGPVQFLHNLIGTRSDGVTGLPNGYDGIHVGSGGQCSRWRR